MKKNNLPSKGFTLIEVLISLVILSIITVITSSFLQSSIQSKEIVFSKSAHTLKINLLADALREDVTNAVNIPLLDSRGEPQTRTFYSGQNSDSFTFITKIRSGKSFSSSMVQVQYLVEDDKLLRRQFFAPAPSNLSRFSETVLLQNIKNINYEDVGDIEVQSSKLKTINAGSDYYVSSTDEYPILFVIAALTKGTSVFEGIEDLANKESNRIKEMKKILNQVGVRCISSKNEMKIFGKSKLKSSKVGIKVPNLGDHRICMSAVILSFVTGINAEIKKFETVRTSSPSFLEIIKRLGGKFEIKKTS